MSVCMLAGQCVRKDCHLAFSLLYINVKLVIGCDFFFQIGVRSQGRSYN